MAEVAAIEARGLKKVYQTHFWERPHTGLDGLDLTVPAGGVYGFVGPNGAGKTTTIKILMGLHGATAGEARFFGRDIRDPAARAVVGFLPERPYFYTHLSARETLRLYGALSGLGGAALDARVDALLARVELARFADVALGKYSKGMLQRVGLCQALLHAPRLLVLDEPMSGLDPLGRALVRDLILEENRRGCTVFFSSHILHDIETLCDRVAVMVGGRLRGEGTVASLVGDAVLRVEITLRLGAGAPAPAGAVLLEGGRARLAVAPEAAEAALAAASAAGHTLIEYTPVRKTLEDVFLDEVERARPVDVRRIGVLS